MEDITKKELSVTMRALNGHNQKTIAIDFGIKVRDVQTAVLKVCMSINPEITKVCYEIKRNGRYKVRPLFLLRRYKRDFAEAIKELWFELRDKDILDKNHPGVL